MNSFIFRLPQTIIRAFGFVNLPSLKYFQAPISDSNLSLEIVDSIANINYDLLSSVNEKKIEVFSLKDNLREFPSPALIESNLVHKNHFLFKGIPVKYLVPYASNVFNPKYSDIKDVRAFLKCLRDSWNYKQLVSPKGVLDWASMILDENYGGYTPWFWDRIELDTKIYQARIKSAEIFLGKKSDLIRRIRASKNPIIIQPTRSLINSTYDEVIEYYYNQSTKFRTMVDIGDVSIYIKPHRSEVLYEKIRTTYSFRGNEVSFPNNLYDFYIPTEILLNIDNNVTLVSEVSSSVFNSFIKRNIIIKNELTKNLFNQYGLISHRFKSKDTYYK
jgi:hypothetical protein